MNFTKKIIPHLYSAAGSFIIVAGWNWYHLKHRPHGHFIIISLALWVALYIGFRIFKYLFTIVAKRLNRHPFWHQEFAASSLDELFFFGSLFFIVFFSRSELISLIYVSLVFGILFWQTNRTLARHPAAHAWLTVNRSIFLFAYLIFALQALLQFTANRYYILDENSRFFNIVVFRSVAMTSFWLLGFAISSLLYWQFKSWLRYAAIGAWSLFFIVVLGLWSVNIGALYYSGLYISPVAFDHIRGSGGIVSNDLTYLLLALLAVVIVAVVITLRKFIRAHELAPRRYWYFYQTAVIVIALGGLFGLSSFNNTPERVIANAFWDRWRGVSNSITLPTALQTKLAERFGLHYDLNNFAVTHQPTVFNSSAAQLLPPRLQKQKPNVVIIFLESFSSRLTEVYNPRLVGLTPGLKKMTTHPDTTVFKKYFNASTPTVTGLLSQLCSFLPPTGHEEIQNQRRLQRHHLLCLPKVLRERGGYDSATYITAVAKDFANKGSIFESMGTDEVYGLEELKKYIPGEPLSWGWSDHQMFPVTAQFMANKKIRQPFLMMLSTVDTHPPFNLAKDTVKYGDGKNALLNAVHTTDDAFSKFWDEFISSDFATNTILIAVADHAVFPAAYSKDAFPAETGKLTFYDENFFAMYIPNTVLPRQVDMYSSGLDFTPTLLNILNINVPNTFEGHSIFDDRNKYPNVLGMHELGLYINQTLDSKGTRKVDYQVPHTINCTLDEASVSSTLPLTLCEFRHFYKWKRRMLEEGRLWNPGT